MGRGRSDKSALLCARTPTIGPLIFPSPFSFFLSSFAFAGPEFATPLRQTGVGQASDRRRTGVGQASDRRRTGVGQASDRRRTGVGQASDRRRTGVGQTSDRHRTGVDRRRTAVGQVSDRRLTGVGLKSRKGRVFRLRGMQQHRRRDPATSIRNSVRLRSAYGG